jgi:hypothetical protein
MMITRYPGIPFNNTDLGQWNNVGTLQRGPGTMQMNGLGYGASYGASYGSTPAPAPAASGGGLTSAVSAVSGAVTGVLQAEQAQTLINQEKALGATLTPMIPFIVIAAIGLLYLSSSKK